MNKLLYFNYLLLGKLSELLVVMDCLPGNVYWKDTKGRYLGRNKCAEETMTEFGIDDAGFVGMSNFDMFSTDSASQFNDHDKYTLESDAEQVYEETLFLPDGSINVQYSIKRPLKYKNKTIGIIGNSINITHLKNIEKELKSLKEQAQQSEQAKKVFLQNIEHDLKTPSSVIELATRQLQQKEDDPVKMDLLNNIAFSSKNILDNFNQLIEFSRLNMKKPLSMQAIELLPFLENIVNIYKLKNTRMIVDIQLELDPDLPAYITSNPYALSRVLSNLLDNALKFTCEGFILLRVTDSPMDDMDNSAICFEVIDTGLGISEFNSKHVFDSFYKVRDSNSNNIQGSGLGLSIVKELVDQLDGTITLTSQLDHGSTFKCNIPFVINCKPIEKSSELQSQIDSLLPLRVMLIEDHEICAKLTVTLLEHSQFEVQTASCGAEALALAEHQHFDVILTDIGLPDTDGFIITKQIRERFLHLQNTMIFALSAHSEESYKSEVENSVFDGFLTKPFSTEDFKTLLLSQRNGSSGDDSAREIY